MFSIKNKYFLMIESIKDIDLNNIKIFNKYNIIYRNKKSVDNIDKLLKFRLLCKSKKIDFYISNNTRLMISLKADGLYISAKNRNLRLAQLKNNNYKIIGSAHNIKEINFKILQGCSDILFSRLFETSYNFKKGFLGLIKFNLYTMYSNQNLVPLGGIRINNLNKLKIVQCKSFAILSEVKKKPAKILSRLF